MRYLHGVVDSLRRIATDTTPPLSTESLLDVIRDAVHVSAERFSGRGLRLTFDIDPTITVVVNRHRLMQAFANLAQNAFEAYGPETEDPFLEVRAQAMENAVVVTLRDGGCGIPDDALPLVYELFKSQGKENGTGIGLTMAKRIVEYEHGGSLRIESREGHGTTVRIELPTGGV